jgi:hypothetical protein
MKVNIVSATLRYSREEKGAWKSLELGVEASLDDREKWQAAQAQLYSELAAQLKQLWSQNGSEHSQNHQEAPRIDTQPSSAIDNHTSAPEKASLPVPEHWCREHVTEFQRRTGKNGVFYSHKVADGIWCNERVSK